MGVKMLRIEQTILLFLLSFWMTTVNAASLTVDSIGGFWSNPVTTSGPAGPVTGAGTSKIQWGVAASKSTTQSAYRFAGAGPVTRTAPGAFLLGQFTHTNGTIWTSSTQLASGNLKVGISGNAGGKAFSLQSTFRFTHNETLNPSLACPAGPLRPCGDLVNISLLSGAPLVIIQGQTIYSLLIDGFVRSLGGPVVTNLLTLENTQQSLYLQARLLTRTLPPPPPPPPPPPAPVPLPAGGALIGTALALLGLIRGIARRRR